MRDDLDIRPENRSGTDVIGVPMAVDHVRYRLVSNVFDRGQHVFTDRRRCVDSDDTIAGHDEGRVIAAAGNPIETATKLLDMVAEPLEAVGGEILRIISRRISRVLPGLRKAVMVDPEKVGLVGRSDQLLVSVAHLLNPQCSQYRKKWVVKRLAGESAGQP